MAGAVRSPRVVKDYAERVAPSGSHPAHAVPVIHAICAAAAAHRPMMHGEDDGVSLAKRHDLRARLHARPLLGDDELTSREVLPRLREQDRHLQRKDTLSVEILVQAVVVTRAIRAQQRGRASLAGLAAASETLPMLARVP